MVAKPSFVLDTSPLTALCRFPLEGTPYIHNIIQHADLILPEGVVTEAHGGSGVIARIALPLVKHGVIQSRPAPLEPLILDSSYSRDLGQGEREVIKIALAGKVTPVIDDKDAFIVASRFRLHPIGFQDLIVQLATEHGLPKSTAREIVQSTARQFPGMFLAHTLSMLGQE